LTASRREIQWIESGNLPIDVETGPRQEDAVRFWIHIDRNPGEAKENSTETPTRAIFDYFWFRYPNSVLCRWTENGTICSGENLDTTKTVSPRANEKKTKETIGKLYTEDDCTSLHKFTLSDVQRTLQYLRFVEKRGVKYLKASWYPDDPLLTVVC
jgi:hypothetical protein